jgi:hypothetical protein
MTSTFANPLDAAEPTLSTRIEQQRDEAFMTLLLAMNDTRKRIAILCLLSFLALC